MVERGPSHSVKHCQSAMHRRCVPFLPIRLNRQNVVLRETRVTCNILHQIAAGQYRSMLPSCRFPVPFLAEPRPVTCDTNLSLETTPSDGTAEMDVQQYAL